VVAALEDDLNTPQAVAELFALARSINRTEQAAERRARAEALRSGAWLLGLLQRDPAAWFAGVSAERAETAPSEAEIDALVQRREALRRKREFAAADEIRDELAELGVVVEDRADGSRWRRARQS
jgi:cysteinyl-tRNA synthetase